ncbi:MAG: DNA repair protein RecO [Syntrophotaleaceae bacterium]
MNLHHSEAIVLHHVNYGEADRIVSFLTREQGLLKGFARGARKSRKRFGTSLEPFSQVQIHWKASTRGSLVSLQEVDLFDLRIDLRRDPKALALAAYGCELVEVLLGEGQAQPDVFALLRSFLDHIAGADTPHEARLLFDLRMLVLTGYIPHLLHCADCGGSLSSDRAAFAAVRGGSLCPQCSGQGEPLQVSPLTLGTLARSLQTPITLFEGFRFSEQTLREGCAVLRSALHPHLPRPLKSLRFLDRVSAGSPPAGGAEGG